MKVVALVADEEALVFDTDDVEDFDFSTPQETHAVTEKSWLMGRQTFNLSVRFKEGRFSTWVPVDQVDTSASLTLERFVGAG